MLDLPGDMALLCYPPLQCSVPEQPWHPPAAAWPLCATVLSCLPALLGPRPAGPIDGQAQGTLGGRQKRGRGREGEGKKREKEGRGKERWEGKMKNTLSLVVGLHACCCACCAQLHWSVVYIPRPCLLLVKYLIKWLAVNRWSLLVMFCVWQASLFSLLLKRNCEGR